MTNLEWLIAEHKDLVIDALCGEHQLALKNGQPTRCSEITCKECEFGCGSGCALKMQHWLLDEHGKITYTIPLDTPIDTKVLVSDDGKKWTRRRFAGFNSKSCLHYMTWSHGADSWTSETKTEWLYCKLWEEGMD